MKAIRRGRTVSLLFTLALLTACGSINSLVGGDCPEGLSYDGERCVALDAGTLYPNGDDGGAHFDATTDGSADDGGGSGDATGSDGSGSNDGSSSDGGGSGDGSSSDGSDDGGDGGGGPVCDPQFTLCNGTCVDLQTDPNHCGNCNIQCPTLICVAGQCQGALDGHVVMIGHDFSGITSLSQRRVLGNAALLPPVNSIRVRSWEQWSSSSAVAVVRGVISSAATGQGRTVVFTQAMNTNDVLATTLQNTDILLLNDQTNAPASTLSGLGTTFAPSLAAFTKAGGIVVVTDGGSGQMPDLVKSAGLLDLASETSVSFATNLTVAAPADAIGLGVLSPYAAGQKTVHYVSNEPNAGQVTWVVVDATGDSGVHPVVIHKVVP